MALEKDSQRCVLQCCSIVVMVLAIIVTVPLIGYYGHLIASGYTEFAKTNCEFIGVLPKTATCSNSTVFWSCEGERLYNAAISFPNGISNLTFP